MQRLFRLLGALFAMVVAVGMMLASTVLGDTTPLILPFTAGLAFTGENNTELPALPEFISSNGTVVCLTAPASGTIDSNLPPLGTFHIEFKDCLDKTTKAKCTGEGEAIGVILVLGTWHLPWDEEGSTFELHVGTLFLIELVSFHCTALVLLEVKGSELCLDLKPEESNKIHSFHCIALGTKQMDSWCVKDESGCKELMTPLLLTSVNKAPFKESAELALGETISVNALATMAL